MQLLLTECGLEAVGGTLADAIPAVGVELYAMQMEEGREVRDGQVTMDVGKHVPDACDEG